ncbi:hypothetical protein Barb4_03883 [Bacteroidales bacterium Barb4]|nr:hypothetical protein Barb4_03883 [Bacteroidales bacterium Barb4]
MERHRQGSSERTTGIIRCILYLYRPCRTFLTTSFRYPTFRYAACGAEISHPFGIGTTPNRVSNPVRGSQKQQKTSHVPKYCKLIKLFSLIEAPAID